MKMEPNYKWQKMKNEKNKMEKQKTKKEAWLVKKNIGRGRR